MATTQRWADLVGRQLFWQPFQVKDPFAPWEHGIGGSTFKGPYAELLEQALPGRPSMARIAGYLAHITMSERQGLYWPDVIREVGFALQSRRLESGKAGDGSADIGDVPLSPKQLAVRHNVDHDSLRRRLERRRKHDGNCFVEIENRSGHEPQFLYWEARITDIIEDLKSSTPRPPQKKSM